MFWYIVLIVFVFLVLFWVIIKCSCKHLSNDDTRALNDNELKEYEILKKESEKDENLGT